MITVTVDSRQVSINRKISLELLAYAKKIELTRKMQKLRCWIYYRNASPHKDNPLGSNFYASMCLAVQSKYHKYDFVLLRFCEIPMESFGTLIELAIKNSKKQLKMLYKSKVVK